MSFSAAAFGAQLRGFFAGLFERLAKPVFCPDTLKQ